MPDRVDLNVLFVCSMNQWRSPTAEKVYADRPFVNVRSRGTNRKANQTIRPRDLDWADIVIVMEQRHRQRLQNEYPSHLKFKTLFVLDIPDEYQFMDADLIGQLTTAVDAILADSSNE
ncbi:MAG: putative protein tyrosine phosphatase [Mariniblastus sp.]|jgi:predicted protein tyrosine phosphatase